MPTCLVGLGANLGRREAMLHRAVQAIDQIAGVRVTAHSRTIETQAIGGSADQGAYLNAALTLETDASVSVLLDRLLEVERRLGRTRSLHWGPRTIDVDLLLHGQTVVESTDLMVPHPWMMVRRFVLEPAVEIAADLRHPQIGWTIRQLFDHLQQGSAYMAVTGCDRQLVAEAVQGAVTQWGGHALGDPQSVPRFDDSHVAPEDSIELEESLVASEIALLHARAAAMSKSASDSEAPPVISGFWLADALASTAPLATTPLATTPRRGPSSPSHELTEQIEDVQSGQVPPWLVVLLERIAPEQQGIGAPRGTTKQPEKPSGNQPAGRQLNPVRLRELVMHAAPGPWLKLQVTTPQQAARLLIAAMGSRGPRLPHPRRNA